MPPQNQNDPNSPGRYDFFMNPEHPSKPRLSGPTSMKSRIIVVVGGFILLIIIFSVISSILHSGPTATGLQTSVAEDQQEIIRLCLAAEGSASSAVTQNFAITAEFTVTSDQQALITYLTGQGTKLAANTLSLKQSAKTDSELASGLSAGVYDQTFTDVMTTDFTNYLNDINTAYKKTSGTNGRKLLKQQYASGQVLLKQLKNLPADSP